MRPFLLALALLFPATAHAKPDVCKSKFDAKILQENGKPTDEGVGVICADVTGDGVKDGVVTVDSGGTAGVTHFGVIEGPAGSLALFQEGYKLGIDVVNDRRFDVQQPMYKKNDGNCCPSSFFFTPYRYVGGSFVAGKAHHYKNPKKRFYQD